MQLHPHIPSSQSFAILHEKFVSWLGVSFLAMELSTGMHKTYAAIIHFN